MRLRPDGLTFNEALNVATRRIKPGSYFLQRHGGWFRPDCAGYTRSIAEAGLYDETDARGHIDVEGLSVVPANDMLDMIDAEIRTAEHKLVLLQALRKKIASS